MDNKLSHKEVHASLREISEALVTAKAELEALEDPDDFPNVAIGDCERGLRALESLRRHLGANEPVE